MQIERITPEQALEKMQDQDCIVFDVRPDKKLYDEGHIEGAVSFPADTVTEQTAATMIPAKDTSVILYCRTGFNAEKVTEKLMGYGYINVYWLGALSDWPFGVVKN